LCRAVSQTEASEKSPLRGAFGYAASEIPLDPASQHKQDLRLLLHCQRLSGRHVMPFGQATPAARTSGMLGDKDRMATHGRLLAVVGWVGRSQTFGDEGRTMLHDGIKAPAFEIESRLIVQMKAGAEPGSGKAFKQLFGIKSAHQPTTF